MIHNVVLTQGTNTLLMNICLNGVGSIIVKEDSLFLGKSTIVCAFVYFTKNNKDLSNAETCAVRFLTTDRSVQQKLSISVDL